MHMDTHVCLHRRRFGALAVGLAGFALMPLRASAAGHADALALTCMDYRLVDDEVHFFDEHHLTNEYDQVSLAGASLAAVSPKFPSSNMAFWDHVEIAKTLHHIKKVIVLDHRDCVAYKVAFGEKFAAERSAETEQHKSVMAEFKAALAKRHSDLASEFYLPALDGTAEQIAL
jgi:carbonic anhydrase